MFGSLTIDQLLDSANDLIEMMARVIPGFPQDRKGGYICIMDRTDGTLISLTRVGSFLKDNWLVYSALAQEKAQRVLSTSGRISSWEDRDESKMRYGGAIRASQFTLSFSGLTEHADELLVLFLAKSAGLVNHEDCCAIAKISNNRLYLDSLLVG